jgi:predicted nuclease of predicted toxin-antitoxin system
MAGMRILLDECLPRRLKRHLPAEFVVSTVQERGWNGLRNGELLRLAESEFDFFVTVDRNVQYQQKLAGFNLSVILLRAASNRLVDLVPIVPDLVKALQTAAPGTINQVPASKT